MDNLNTEKHLSATPAIQPLSHSGQGRTAHPGSSGNGHVRAPVQPQVHRVSPAPAPAIMLTRAHRVGKRLMDIVGAAAGLLLFAPLMLLIALAIRLSDGGAVIFTQERYGRGQQKFRIYKFRTMVTNAEEMLASIEHLNESCGALFKIKKDPRLTAFGKLLRKTSLDELPQLINVLRGEMSLVGPRPLSLRDAAHFDKEWLKRRCQMRPGLTCLWQINGRSHLTSQQLAQLDVQYLEQWSLLLDMKILLKTIPAVLKGKGAA